MTDKVSKSKTGQNERVPTRAERDAASSSTGGRKAVEVEKKQDGSASKVNEIAPPVGLDLETRGDEEWSHSSADVGSSGEQSDSRRYDERSADREDTSANEDADIE